MPAKPTIFISYRREPAADLARLIHDRLVARGYDVFLDVETINGGRFATIIQREIAARDVLLVILTPTTLESEWVRREVQTAFENNKTIVPLAAHGFTFGAGLPPEVSDLGNHDAVRWEHDFADAAFERLLRAVDPANSGRKPRFNLSLAVGALSITCTAVVLFAFLPTLLFNSQKPPSVNATQQVAIAATGEMEVSSGELATPASNILSTQPPAPLPESTATRVISAVSTATELMLERTAAAQQATNAALMTENALLFLTATPPVNCPGSPPPRLKAGEQGRISGDSLPSRLRTSPESSDIILNIPPGAVFNVIQGPTCADGLTWWRVEYQRAIGWVAEGLEDEYWLEPVE